MDKFYADSMGFLNLPGNPPVADKNLIQPEIGANINLIHLTSAPPWLNTTEEVLEAHRKFVETLERQNIFKIIRTKNDLKPFSDGTNRFNVAVVLGLQNTPNDVLENGNLKRLFDAGIRIMALAYEGENSFGGGCMVKTTLLKEKGLSLLNEFAKNKIIFDVSHASILTVWGVITSRKYSLKNLSMFASHSGCYVLYRHNRNLCDYLIKSIIEYKGIIGMPTLNFILGSKDNSLELFIKHIKHMVCLVGEDNICVGSDGIYKQFNVEELESHHKIMLQNIKEEYKENWKARFPEHPLETYTPRKMQIIAEKLSEFYSQKVVDKICGLNFLRFLEINLPD